MNVAKEVLRTEIKTAIKKLSAKDILVQSASVQLQLLRSNFYKNATRISVYIAFGQEVQTDLILEDLFGGTRKVFVPFVPLSGSVGRMKMLKISSKDDLVPYNVFKSVSILQPTNPDQREEALSDGLDLMIVPGLAFDKEGSRLGRGKGYYDEYISKVKAKNPSVKTVGLALAPQMIEPGRIPMLGFDQELDHVIYPEEE